MPFNSPPHPFNHVFGTAFDENLLFQLCREGPRAGDHSLLGDIKLIWDFSRGQPLVTNAACGQEQLEACLAFLGRWIEANSNLRGAAWSCAMEIAIRGVNWVFADVLFEGALGKQLGNAEWAGWLWRHGWLTWRRLEAQLVPSNHYLADLLGLLILGALFPEDPQARSWRRFAASEFSKALLAQTNADGGLDEASMRYHVFVTEMALLFRLALGTPLAGRAEARLVQMCQTIADFRDASGDVFALGDDDSGRVLGLDFASPLARAEVVLRLASAILGRKFESAAGAVCEQSGWWVRRVGDFTTALDFGGVGMHGLGPHAHNDDLSFCLDWRGQQIIVDPGTCLYTSDIKTRNRFRSTCFHNTVIIDGCEQRPLTSEPFRLWGPARPFGARKLSEGAWEFSRRAAPGISHRRVLFVRETEVVIRDTLEGSGRHRLEWRFQLHPDVEASVSENGFTLRIPGEGKLLINWVMPPDRMQQGRGRFSVHLALGEYSPAYGRRRASQAVIAEGEFELPFNIEWRIRAEPSPSTSWSARRADPAR
jgi:hypothetical protein